MYYNVFIIHIYIIHITYNNIYNLTLYIYKYYFNIIYIMCNNEWSK